MLFWLCMHFLNEYKKKSDFSFSNRFLKIAFFENNMANNF